MRREMLKPLCCSIGMQYDILLRGLITPQGTSNLVDAVRELITILQGNPYNYDEDDEDDKSAEQAEQQTIHSPQVDS